MITAGTSVRSAPAASTSRARSCRAIPRPQSMHPAEKPPNFASASSAVPTPHLAPSVVEVLVPFACVLFVFNDQTRPCARRVSTARTGRPFWSSVMPRPSPGLSLLFWQIQSVPGHTQSRPIAAVRRRRRPALSWRTSQIRMLLEKFFVRCAAAAAGGDGARSASVAA